MTNVEVFHIQAETDWNTLCDTDCLSCKLTSKANRLNLAKAHDLLTGIIPSRTTEAASISSSKAATLIAPKKARMHERSDVDHSEDLRKRVKALVDGHDDYTSMLVIQSICDCLNVEGGLFQLVSQHDTPVNCLVYLIEQYKRRFEAIERIYAAAARDATLGTVSAAVALECFDITDVALEDHDITAAPSPEEEMQDAEAPKPSSSSPARHEREVSDHDQDDDVTDNSDDGDKSPPRKQVKPSGKGKGRSQPTASTSRRRDNYERRPRPVVHRTRSRQHLDQERQEGKGSRGKDKTFGKAKNKFEGKKGGKGKGNYSPPQYCVHTEKLSKEAKDFHENVSAIPLSNEDSLWKNEVLKYFKIHEDVRERNYFLDNCFRHLDDVGKDKKAVSNKRIYLGPGRDGSSDDKIPINCKFESNNTKITFNKNWPSQGYVKSSFVVEDEGDEWKLVENQVYLAEETTLPVKARKIAIVIHPMFTTSEDITLVANFAIDPAYDFEEECNCY